MLTLRQTGLETKKERKSKRTRYISFATLFLGSEPGYACVYMQLELDISTLLVQHFRRNVPCHHTAKHTVWSIHTLVVPSLTRIAVEPPSFISSLDGVHQFIHRRMKLPSPHIPSGRGMVSGEVVPRRFSHDDVVLTRSSMSWGRKLATNRISAESAW